MNDECQIIDAYLDGELSPERAALFEIHLGVCEACQAEVEIDLGLGERLRVGWSAIAAPMHLRQGPAPIQRPEIAIGIKRHIGKVLVAIAASVLVMIAIAKWAGSPGGGDSEEGHLARQNRSVASENDLVEVVTTDQPIPDQLIPARQNVAWVGVLQPEDGSQVKTIFVRPPRVSSEFTIVSAYSVVSADTADR